MKVVAGRTGSAATTSTRSHTGRIPDERAGSRIPRILMATRTQTQEADVSTARRLAQEVFSKGNMQAFDEIFSDRYVNHNIPVPGIPGTKAGFRELVLATRKAFPDAQVQVEDVVAEDDFVVFHDRVT